MDITLRPGFSFAFGSSHTSPALQYNLAMTDPAKGDVLGHALAAQGRRLTEVERALSGLGPGVQSLSEQLQALAARTNQIMARFDSMAPAPTGSAISATSATSAPSPSPLASPVHQSEPRAPPIERYDGNPETCRSFLTLCSLTFELQPITFATERSRIAFMITNLTGRAREWATAEWERHSPICDSVVAFSAALGRVFGQPASGREAARALGNLRQGRSRVFDHAIRFRTLAAESKWNDEALVDTFWMSLSEDIKDRLTMVDLPKTFEDLVDLAIKIDNRLQERERFRGTTGHEGRQRWSQNSSTTLPGVGTPLVHRPSYPGPTPSGSQEEPMQLGRTRLSPDERRRRHREGLCLYCGGTGHFLAGCPVKDQARQ